MADAQIVINGGAAPLPITTLGGYSAGSSVTDPTQFRIENGAGSTVVPTQAIPAAGGSVTVSGLTITDLGTTTRVSGSGGLSGTFTDLSIQAGPNAPVGVGFALKQFAGDTSSPGYALFDTSGSADVVVGNPAAIAIAQDGTVAPSVRPNQSQGGSSYWEVWSADGSTMLDHCVIPANNAPSYGVGVNGLFSFSTYDNAYSPFGAADFRALPGCPLYTGLQIRATFQNNVYSCHFNTVSAYPTLQIGSPGVTLPGWLTPGSQVGVSGAPPNQTPIYATDYGSNITGGGLFVYDPSNNQVANGFTAQENGWLVSAVSGGYFVIPPHTADKTYAAPGSNFHVIDTTAGSGRISVAYFNLGAGAAAPSPAARAYLY